MTGSKDKEQEPAGQYCELDLPLLFTMFGMQGTKEGFKLIKWNKEDRVRDIIMMIHIASQENC